MHSSTPSGCNLVLLKIFRLANYLYSDIAVDLALHRFFCMSQEMPVFECSDGHRKIGSYIKVTKSRVAVKPAVDVSTDDIRGRCIDLFDR